jgi:hypothetical protein
MPRRDSATTAAVSETWPPLSAPACPPAPVPLVVRRTTAYFLSALVGLVAPVCSHRYAIACLLPLVCRHLLRLDRVVQLNLVLSRVCPARLSSARPFRLAWLACV